MELSEKNTTKRIILLVIVGVICVLVTAVVSNRYLSGLLREVLHEAKSDREVRLVGEVQKRFAEAELALLSFKMYNDSVYYFGYRRALEAQDSLRNELRKGESNREIAGLMKQLAELSEEKEVVLDSLFRYDFLPDFQGVLDGLESDLINIPVVQNEKRLLLAQKKMRERYEAQAGNVFANLRNELKKAIRIREQDYAWIHAELINVTNRIAKVSRMITEKKTGITMSKGSIAEKKAEQTKIIILVFSLVIAILMLVLIWFIIRYQRSVRESREQAERAKKNAEELAKTREDFLANMSHEIRTPMNAIAGFTDELLKSELQPDTFESLLVIKKSSDHLLQIINEILDFSTLEKGSMKLEAVKFDPALIVEDVLTIVKSGSLEKGNKIEVEFSEDVPEWVVGDPSRLRQILLNLVGNATKFTENGQITIEVNVQEKQSAYCELVFTIADTGIGIPEEKLEGIFDTFTQASSDTFRKYGGSGLGLSITKRLVDLFGGTIHLESELDKGTVFTVTIPVDLVEEISATENLKEEVEEKLNLNGLKVLIVDDNEFNRKLLRTLLKRNGTETHELSDGTEVMSYLESNPIDIILMDLRMPGKDGSQTTRELKTVQDERIASIPVIGVSATVSPEEKKEALDSGMVAMVTKPFTETRLIHVLQKFVPSKYRVPVGERLDFTELESLDEGGNGFLIELLEIYISSTEEGVENLDQAFKNQDIQAIREAAHKIASPNKHIGAMTLYNHLKELERMAFSGESWKDLRAVMIEVDEEYKAVRYMVEKKLTELKREI